MAIESGESRGPKRGSRTRRRALQELRTDLSSVALSARNRKDTGGSGTQRHDGGAARTIALSREDLARIDEICTSGPVVTAAMREAILKPWTPPAS